MNDIFEEAMAEVEIILTQLMERFSVTISQDELRAAFREAMQTPEGMMAFEQQHGHDVFMRQLELGMRRPNG